MAFLTSHAEGSRERISIAGGTMPVWGPDGRELFFKAAGRMMIVDVQTDSTFVNGPPR